MTYEIDASLCISLKGILNHDTFQFVVEISAWTSDSSRCHRETLASPQAKSEVKEKKLKNDFSHIRVRRQCWQVKEKKTEERLQSYSSTPTVLASEDKINTAPTFNTGYFGA